MEIKFTPAFDFVEKLNIEPPQPSSKFIPKWYKDLNFFIDTENKFFKTPHNNVNMTAKACVPIMDSVTAGYMITLPCDLEFVPMDRFKYRVHWSATHWEPVSEHSYSQVQNLNISEEYENRPLKFNGLWKIKPPRGYSLLYTHPFWNFDLPFLSATAIVDSDIYDLEVNIPFFIKKNFLGVLKAGTPISQVIPIKRDYWHSKKMPFKDGERDLFNGMFLRMSRVYKNSFWQKKEYK